MQAREFETMTPEEKATAYCCICHWHDTNLTHSVYVLGCEDSIEAERKALSFFASKRNPDGFLFREIRAIYVMPRGKGPFDEYKPVFWKDYPASLKAIKCINKQEEYKRKTADELCEEGKSLLRKLPDSMGQDPLVFRLYKILEEMRDVAAVNNINQ